jgi:2-oxoglutarate/2-oxoacid ferredoxin oxidoreductase subunit beta
MTYKDYVRWERMPTTWCPGCAIGTVFKQLTFTLADMAIPREELVVVSGIGCSGRAAGYFKADSVHTTHGRAIPVAEGIKRGNDKLKVVVFSGDGDLAGIGGNHLLHAARRDVDLTVVCINNATYGMTGGQMAPTTPAGQKTLTSPFGAPYRPINLQGLITSNSRYWFARGSAYQILGLQKYFREALEWKGFSFVEVVAFCIENAGRRQGFKNGHEMLLKLKEDFRPVPKPEGPLREHELGVIKNDDQAR